MLSLRFLLRQLSPYVVRATLAPGRDVCPVRTELLHDQTVLLADLGAQPADFDCIVTGDLGHVGADLLLTLLREDNIDLTPVYSDCGSLLFGDEQDAHAGGSGCGCSAAVLCGPLLRDMQAGKIKRLVFAGTGAMMSPTSVQQGQPIAGICHAVVIERSGA